MAQQVIVNIVDNVDRTNLRLSVMLRPGDGRYEVVLPARDTARIRAAVAPFVAAAHRVHVRPRPSAPPPRRPRHDEPERARVIREWARANGYRVSRFGRLPNALIVTYEQYAGEHEREST